MGFLTKMNLVRLVLIALLVVCFGDRAQGQQFQVDRSTIESWIFQRQNGSEQAKKSLAAQIDLKIEAIKSIVQLSEQQVIQLRLAGEGDIKRFYDAVLEVYRKVDDMEMNQNAINEAYQLTTPLQQKLASGLFDDQSLMHKVLRGTLSTEQITALETSEKRRREQIIGTLVRGYLATVDQMIPMSVKQMEQLTEILRERTAKDKLTGEYGIYVVGYRLAKVPEDDLGEILQPVQLKALRQMGNQMEGIAGFLRQQGMIMDEIDAE